MVQTTSPAARARDDAPLINLAGVVVLLLGLNAVSFLVQVLAPVWTNAAGIVPINFQIIVPGDFPITTKLWQAATLVTSSFIHADIQHLGTNMLLLVIAGQAVAVRLMSTAPLRARGALATMVPFLTFYLSAAIVVSLGTVALHPGGQFLTLGASGAISALVGAVARTVFQPLWPLQRRLTPLSHLPTVLVSLLYIGSNLGIAFGFGGPEAAGIAWDSHVVGYVYGLLAFPLFDRWRAGVRDQWREALIRDGHIT